MGRSLSANHVWTPEITDAMVQITDAVGWPHRAFKADLLLEPSTKDEALLGGIGLMPTRDIWALPTWTPNKSGLTEWRVLPLTPIWRGLVVDVAFWAVVAAMLVEGTRYARRRWRRSRGRCVSCGYVLGTLTRCPECGYAHAAALSEDHA